MRKTTSTVEFNEILNLTALSQFQSIFYKLTGLPVSLCNPDLATITFYPKTQRSTLCKLVQTSSEGVERCRNSDLMAINKALKKKRPYIYRCHAGLINVTIPLIIDDRHAGSLISGQVLTMPLTTERLNELKENLQDLPIKERSLIRALENLQVVPEERLRLAAQFLSLIASYIVEAEMRNALWRERGGMGVCEGENDKGEGLVPSGGVETLEERLKRSMPFGGSSNLEKGRSEGEKNTVERVLEFVEGHLSEPLTLRTAADFIHLSPTYFARVFKEETGLTFHDYLTGRRIKEAAHLLKETSLSISEISQRVGYAEPNYFSQVFKRIMGTSPTDYRKMRIMNLTSSRSER